MKTVLEPATLSFSSPKTAELACENCGHAELQTFEVAANNVFLHCPECLLYQKPEPPQYDHYENQYHSQYASRRDKKIRTAMIRLAALTSALEPGRPVKMLDVGCSIGATVEGGRRMGWDAYGVDVSQAAVDYCCEQGLQCQKIDDYELPFEDNSLDVVTSWHVIEHVNNVRVTLDEWFRVIRPGGLLVLETPDSQCLKARRLGKDYTTFWPFDHLYTFTRSNMCSLLEDSGFHTMPSRILGRWNALSPGMTLYALAYRSLRQSYRKLGWCKSIEICCRKPGGSVPAARKYLNAA